MRRIQLTECELKQFVIQEHDKLLTENMLPKLQQIVSKNRTKISKKLFAKLQYAYDKLPGNENTKAERFIVTMGKALRQVVVKSGDAAVAGLFAAFGKQMASVLMQAAPSVANPIMIVVTVIAFFLYIYFKSQKENPEFG